MEEQMRKGVLAIVVGALVLLASIPSYADGFFNMFGHSEKGSGDMKTVELNLPPFTEIRSSGSFDIHVKVGGEQKVTMTFDDNLIDNIETEVTGHTLHIGTKESFSSERGCHFEITVPSLERIKLSGSGDIEVENLDEDHFEYSVSGSGSLRAAGKVSDLDVRVAGSGDVDTKDLVAENASVRISGSGDVRVRVTDSFDGSISGSGSIYYYGNPAHASTSISGSGSIRKRAD